MIMLLRILLLGLGVSLLLSACFAQSGDDAGRGQVRKPCVAGAFYPGRPDTLRRQVQTLLGNVPAVRPAGRIVAALAPHAGYVFSGPVAAYTHKALADLAVDTVVVIGHDSHAPGVVAFVCPMDAFETPLGEVPVDRAMVDALLKAHPGIRADRSMHAREHTVEVQLPFFQAQGQTWKVVPVLFGDPTIENCRIFANAVAAAAGPKRVLVLASTDMSHYPPYDAARKVDLATLEVLRRFDIQALFTHLDAQERAGVPGLQTAMCARGGVGTALLFAQAQGADHVQVLHYANSGDVSGGDRSRVVGYGAALIVKQEKPTAE